MGDSGRPQREALRAILDVAHATSLRGEGISLKNAIARSGYCDVRPTIGPGDLLDVLLHEPDLVHQWILYSEDKRTSGGWYVLRTAEVGRLEPKVLEHFDSLSRAVAEFILRELDFWAAGPDLGKGDH